MGVLLSAFLWTYALAQAPVGALIDRFGPRRLLGGALGLWSAAQAATGFAGSLGALIAARLALGVGESPQFPVGARVVRDGFEPEHRGAAAGVFNSASTLGPAISPPIVTALMLALGWRGAFIATGLAGFLVAAIWLALYRDRRADDAPAAGGAIPLRRLLSQPTLWAAGAETAHSAHAIVFPAPEGPQTNVTLRFADARSMSSVTRGRGRSGTLGHGTTVLSSAGSRTMRRSSSRSPAVRGAVAWCGAAGELPRRYSGSDEPSLREFPHDSGPRDSAPCSVRRASRTRLRSVGSPIVPVICPPKGPASTSHRSARPPSWRTNAQLQPTGTVPARCTQQPRITLSRAGCGTTWALLLLAERLPELGFLIA